MRERDVREPCPRPFTRHGATNVESDNVSISVLTFKDPLLYLVFEFEVRTRISNPTCSQVARPSHRCGIPRAADRLFVVRLSEKPSFGPHNGLWDMEGTSP